MAEFITRFAPSPTGLLHLGHAYSALTAARAAERAGGDLILRIEDIDRVRCRPEFEKALLEDLEWLGIKWAGEVRRQSDHFADYDIALEKLIGHGVVYRCFRTRKEILDEIARAPHLGGAGPDGPVFVGAPLPEPEEKAAIRSGAPYAWRLSMRAALDLERRELFITGESLDGAPIGETRAAPEIFGDAIIARKDAGTSYHLASVHDDALQGVTHVIRGEDLRAAAHLHALLQALLGYPAPVYRHHPLITDDAGKRLAKRDKAATLRALREAGVTPADVRRRLGFTD